MSDKTLTVKIEIPKPLMMFVDECPGCGRCHVRECPAACQVTNFRNGKDVPFSRWCQDCGLVFDPIDFNTLVPEQLKHMSARLYVREYQSHSWISRERLLEITPEETLKYFDHRPRGSWARYGLKVKIGHAKLARDLRREMEAEDG